jgi:hypothetical protein
MSLTKVLLCLSVVILACSAVTTVTFGISLSLVAEDPSLVSRLGTQRECNAGLIVFRDWFNSLPAASRSLKLANNVSEPLLVDLVIMEDKFNDTIRWTNYQELAGRADVDFLFAPCGTPQSHPIADMVYADYGRQIIMGS